MNIIEWLMQNWDSVIAIYLGVVGVASIIVKMTPTLRDDTILKNIVRFMGRFIALNRK